MKVRLAYAVELNELTDRFASLANDNVLPLEQTTALLKAAAEILKIDGDESVEHVGVIIDKVRRKLAFIDESLNELSTLMQAYVQNVLSSLPQENISQPEPPVTEPNTYNYEPKHTVPSHDSESE